MMNRIRMHIIISLITCIICGFFLIKCKDNRAQMHDILIDNKTVALSILITDMEQISSPFEEVVNYFLILPSFVIEDSEEFYVQPYQSEKKYLFQKNELQYWEMKDSDLHIVLLPVKHIQFSDAYFGVFWKEGYFSQNRDGAFQLTSHDFYIDDKNKQEYCEYQRLFQVYISMLETIKRDLSQNINQ